MAQMIAPMMIASTVMTAAGQYKAGRSAKASADFEAAQLEQNAGQTLAASQREAMEQDRQGRLQASRALAVAAASGGGASDPTVINMMATLAGEANYKKMTALYEGQTQADMMRTQAEATRIEGSEARRAGMMGAATSLLSGGASLYSKYGMKKEVA